MNATVVKEMLNVIRALYEQMSYVETVTEKNDTGQKMGQ